MKEKNENKTRGSIDPALVAKAKAGDQSAVTALYEQTYTGLYRSIRSMVHDEDLAWDILQDSYLKAFQNLEKLEADGAFLSWLKRIAVNETARQMSKRLPTTFTELSSDEDDDAMPELPDLNPDNQPELALDRQETSRLVKEILAELPEQQQLVIGMRYYEDMDTKEIAELLHLAPSTVRVQLHAGRKKVETKVRALEQQGLKLYGLAPFPFLLALLRRMEPAEAAERKTLAAILSQAPAASSAVTAGGAAAGAQAVKVTAMTAGQAIRHGLAAKLAAGALAVCMIGGGIFAGAKLLENKQPDRGDVQPTEPVVIASRKQTTTNSETPTESATALTEIATETDAPEETVPEETASAPVSDPEQEKEACLEALRKAVFIGPVIAGEDKESTYVSNLWWPELDPEFATERNNQYYLEDLDGDGMPELLAYGDYADSLDLFVYDYRDGTLPQYCGTFGRPNANSTILVQPDCYCVCNRGSQEFTEKLMEMREGGEQWVFERGLNVGYYGPDYVPIPDSGSLSKQEDDVTHLVNYTLYACYTADNRRVGKPDSQWGDIIPYLLRFEDPATGDTYYMDVNGYITEAEYLDLEQKILARSEREIVLEDNEQMFPELPLVQPKVLDALELVDALGGLDDRPEWEAARQLVEAARN